MRRPIRRNREALLNVCSQCIARISSVPRFGPSNRAAPAAKEAKQGRRLSDLDGNSIDLDASIATAERERTDLYRAR